MQIEDLAVWLRVAAHQSVSRITHFMEGTGTLFTFGAEEYGSAIVISIIHTDASANHAIANIPD